MSRVSVSSLLGQALTGLELFRLCYLKGQGRLGPPGDLNCSVII